MTTEVVHLQDPGPRPGYGLIRVYCGEEDFGSVTAFRSLVTCEECLKRQSEKEYHA
jgi:hypothetical protein